jgi:hypothetical protein
MSLMVGLEREAAYAKKLTQTVNDG